MLKLASIEKAYKTAGGSVPVLKDLSLEIEGAGFCAILGPSGSGKSTLLNIIGLLDRPDSGQVFLDGAPADFASAAEAARLRNRLIGFVFQSFQLLPRLTAWENVALPLLYRNVPRKDRKPQALAMLERVGLGDRAEHHPNQLSGGQMQRVALARALVSNPRLLLADEPTGNLDSVTASEALTLLRTLNRDFGVTIVMVTHDRDLAMTCDRQIEIRDGRIIADTRRQ
ncbi:ABC transporter ATP-binding protein [Caulobacter mirabilis]|uniref:Macrolide ABC transporter ATP-binding protein n=1 Tax=Caulobacter mirabilis TaxID=69666 RepID=A0A2D2AW68_9CAUL|nr:ABC transporter ATP-binding protein [Caulobacter mirabilis]ATQ42262.1 macrolide ABC transporter ATP-binding protein [Caulobacter mirabilis]